MNHLVTALINSTAGTLGSHEGEGGENGTK